MIDLTTISVKPETKRQFKALYRKFCVEMGALPTTHNDFLELLLNIYKEKLSEEEKIKCQNKTNPT